MKEDLTDLLRRFRDELNEKLGSNLEQLILYGSRARGDEMPDSDADVVVVLKDASNEVREKVHQIAYRLMWDSGFEPLIALNIVDHKYYLMLRDADSSYINNIQREGKILWPASETRPNIG
jgi:predicted nucleotidyltransferase